MSINHSTKVTVIASCDQEDCLECQKVISYDYDSCLLMLRSKGWQLPCAIEKTFSKNPQVFCLKHWSENLTDRIRKVNNCS